jgi:hypothetical protein
VEAGMSITRSGTTVAQAVPSRRDFIKVGAAGLAGSTIATGTDTSQGNHTPEHTDAMIKLDRGDSSGQQQSQQPVSAELPGGLLLKGAEHRGAAYVLRP